MMKDFQDWLVKHGRHEDLDDLARDHSHIIAKIKEELARKSGGDDAARQVELANDSQIHRALDVLKVAALYQNLGKQPK